MIRKSILKSKKAQTGGFGMIIGIVMLFMALIVLVAFLPAINDLIHQQRGYQSLNCISSKNVCGAGALDAYCYNATRESDTTSCLIFSIYTPFILIAVLLGGVAGVLYGKGFTPAPQQQGYYG
jgi:hypothetical protein